MIRLNRHASSGLYDRLATGGLGPREARLLFTHARTCTHCRTRLDRVSLALRVFESGRVLEPSAGELRAFENAGLNAALQGSRRSRGTRQAFWWASAAAIASVSAVVTLSFPRELELAARGPPQTSREVVLRIFCAKSSSPLSELKQSAHCGPEEALAFAASSKLAGTHVAIKFSTEGEEWVEGPFRVSGTPGREAPLPLTLALTGRAGALRVLAAFAEKPEELLRAAREEDGRFATLRVQSVRVER
ncbi:MAG: hypothetical protein ACT4TC_16035 [Myxococcaceae bacterium]